MKTPGPAAAFFILRAATQVIDEIQSGVAARGFTDVRPAHGFVFLRVSTGNATVADIAEHLGMSKQAASQLVEQLVQRGYIERRHHPTDRRCTILSLTPRGRACTRAAEEAASAVAAMWRRNLGPGHFDDLLSALSIVVRPGPLRPSW